MLLIGKSLNSFVYVTVGNEKKEFKKIVGNNKKKFKISAKRKKKKFIKKSK
jgi:hypothetical protein